jgi:hypothetical protein
MYGINLARRMLWIRKLRCNISFRVSKAERFEEGETL